MLTLWTVPLDFLVTRETFQIILRLYHAGEVSS